MANPSEETQGRSRCFEINRRGRDFVVGDVHGQLPMLDAMLSALRFDPQRDRLFSVGDLIDRGAQSAETLRRFTGDLGFFAVRGNHEVMLIASDHSLDDFKRWQRYGGYWALSLSRPERLELAARAGELPLTLTLDLADGRRVGLVHAEVPPGRGWDEARAVTLTPEDLWDTEARSTAASLVWGRRRFLALESLRRMRQTGRCASGPETLAAAAAPVAGIDLVICGHSVLADRRPLLLGNSLLIDTGAHEKDGRLTLVEPLTGHYWQCRRQGRALKVSAKPAKITAAFL